MGSERERDAADTWASEFGYISWTHGLGQLVPG
jgi:hypothetical protein